MSKHEWKLYLLAGLIATTASAQPHEIWYVDVNAPGPTHDGDGWATAFLHLQDALDPNNINGPDPGDEIWVAQGTARPPR